MTDHKTESEPRKEDEDLKLEKEKIRDLDVPEEESEKVEGGNRYSVANSPCGGSVAPCGAP